MGFGVSDALGLSDALGDGSVMCEPAVGGVD
jgi:hypothetical protein